MENGTKHIKLRDSNFIHYFLVDGGFLKGGQTCFVSYFLGQKEHDKKSLILRERMRKWERSVNIMVSGREKKSINQTNKQIL